MNINNKKRIKSNIIFIFIYFIFIITFPFLKEVFNINTVPAPELALKIANKSSNLFSSQYKDLFSYFRNKKSLLLEIDKLKNDLENEKNKNILNIENIDEKNNIILAKKIFSDFSSIYSSILLNKGNDDGVLVGDIVFVYNDKAIGEIISVNKNTSLLSLYSKDKNKNESVLKLNYNKDIKDINNNILNVNVDNASSSILIEDKVNINSTVERNYLGSNILIDLYGYGGGDFIAKIPENINVSLGDILYLAEDETKRLGEVVEIEKEEASFFQFLLVRGYYNARENNVYYIKHK